jgi:hypothetical protein
VLLVGGILGVGRDAEVGENLGHLCPDSASVLIKPQ